MKFHLDLDGHPSPARADVPGTAPDDPPRRPPSAGSGPFRRNPTDLPVLQQAVVAQAPPPHPGWFTVDAAGADTLVVPAGARIRGDCCAGSVHVHGEVTGRVRATTGLLLVAHGGRVRGGVEGAGPVVVAGRVQARRGTPAVVARGRLDLACSARVEGDVCHDVVAVYDGARVTGVLRSLDRGRP